MRRTEVKFISNGSNSYEVKTNNPISKSSQNNKNDPNQTYKKLMIDSYTKGNVNR
jgi:hypothetical protein